MSNIYEKSRPMSVRRHRTESSNSQAYGPVTTYYPHVQWVDSLQGVKLPDWKARVARRESATTQMSARKTVVSHEDGTVSLSGYKTSNMQKRDITLTGWLNLHDPSMDPTGFSAAAAANQAAGKFYSAAIRARSALQSGPAIVEAAKTYRMLRHRLTQLLDFRTWKSSLERTKGMNHRNALRDMSGAYLEWKFGWDQAQRDIRGALNALNATMDETKVVRGFGSAVHTDATTSFKHTYGSAEWNCSRSSTATSSCRVVGLIRLYKEGGSELAQSFGLSPENWMPTIWEVLPWSFMFDYVANVSDIINACSLPASAVRWTRSTTKTTCRETVINGLNPRLVDGFTTQTTVSIPDSTVFESTYVQRTNVRPDIPTLEFGIPGFDRSAPWLNTSAIVLTKTFADNFIVGSWRHPLSR